MKLQDFNFKKSRYDRPSAKKACGLSGGCQLGPDSQGNCGGRSQCIPFCKDDRWECTRSQSNGGKCENGPLPDGKCPCYVECVPIDNFRYIRKKTVIFTLLFFSSLCLAVFFSPLKLSFISPGELSSKHGGIGLNQCVDCHSDNVEHPISWLSSAMEEMDAGSGNKHCLNCHKMGAQANLPHGISSQLIKQSATKTISNYFDKLELKAGVSNNAVSCVLCHKEHRGADASLTEISNQQCDSCHLQKHDPFSSVHPEFANFLPTDYKSIEFDHGEHFLKNFKDEKNITPAPEQCDSCHQVSEDRKHMGVKSFEDVCQGCHVKDVTGEKMEPKGIPYLSLPTLDVETLGNKNIQIGEWPEEIDGGELTAFMSFMLSQDESLRLLLVRIEAGEVDLSDLSEVEVQDLALVSRLAWAIKELLFDITEQGHKRLSKALDAGAKSRLTESQKSNLIGALPLNLINVTSHNWFPHLSKEILDYRKGLYTPLRLMDEPSLANKSDKLMDFGGWYVRDYTVFYRPSGHADSFLKSWLELSRDVDKGAPDAPLKNIFKRISARGVPGQCGKCHVGLANNDVDLNWKLERVAFSERPFTEFDHSKHFRIVGREGCASCHKVSEEGNKEYFSPLTKSVCSDCHQTKLAGNNCRTCHNYHVGKLTVELPFTTLHSSATQEGSLRDSSVLP